MCVQRLRERVGTVNVLTIGHISCHRFVFHKKGKDGSAKADAEYTGIESQRVWGVVYSISRFQRSVLDSYEVDYETKRVVVATADGIVSASVYTARSGATDSLLKPFSWYHRLVVQGALQHRLPVCYLQQFQEFESIRDHDMDRHDRNTKLIGGN